MKRIKSPNSDAALARNAFDWLFSGTYIAESPTRRDPRVARALMPKRQRRYRIVVEGPMPEDLAERCAEVWRDVRLAAQHAAVAARRAQERQALGEAGSVPRRPRGA